MDAGLAWGAAAEAKVVAIKDQAVGLQTFVTIQMICTLAWLSRGAGVEAVVAPAGLEAAS